MWAKLPAGSPGLAPVGKLPAASFIGVPHHGGAIAASAAVDPLMGTSNAASRALVSNGDRMERALTCPTSWVSRTSAVAGPTLAGAVRRGSRGTGDGVGRSPPCRGHFLVAQ